MSGSFWTRFRKTEGDEASSDQDVGEKQPEQEVTPVEVGPGGLSFEEGALVRSFAPLLHLGPSTVFAQTLLEGLAVISASPHAPFLSSDVSLVQVSSPPHPPF